jgi:hypothetical protein
MGDIASITNSILVPTEDDECESITESTDPILVPDLKKSRSVNIISELDKPLDKCETLNATIVTNCSTTPISMRMQIRVIETEKPDYLYYAVKFFNKHIKFIETIPNHNNISSNSIVLRGFETLKDSRWTYIHYAKNQLRCTLNPRLLNSKSLYLNALTSPFVSVNFNDITSYNGMFSSMPNIKEIIIEKFDMSRVTSMEEMFVNCIKLQSISFIDCDLSGVETMAKLCFGCTSLKNLKFIRCKMNIMCDYWNMLSNCPLITSITVPLEIYCVMVQETPELELKNIIWHSV